MITVGRKKLWEGLREQEDRCLSGGRVMNPEKISGDLYISVGCTGGTDRGRLFDIQKNESYQLYLPHISINSLYHLVINPSKTQRISIFPTMPRNTTGFPPVPTFYAFPSSTTSFPSTSTPISPNQSKRYSTSLSINLKTNSSKSFTSE